MLESKWVLFILITFTVGNLLASSIDDNFTGSADLQGGIGIITLDDIAQLTPDDSSEDSVREAGISGIGTVAKLLTGLPSALTWNYTFLDQGAGAAFRAIFLYPLSFMFSMMILGFLRNLTRI